MMDEPLILPEWVCTFVGKLVLDNEALRRALPPPPEPSPGDGEVTA